MKVKQIISTGILTLMLVTIRSSGISALANNSGDTAFEDNGYRSLPITLHGAYGGYPSRGVWSPDSV